jgi:uncharacterized membrane protein YkoI
MGRLSALSGALLGTALLIFSLGTHAEDEHDRARRLRDAGDILPLEVIIERAQRERPGRILELHLEEKRNRMLYEVELVDEQGIVWELYFDARSGDLVKTKQED